MIRYLLKMSDDVNLGLGMGASAAVWYRGASDEGFWEEEVVFLPAFVLGVGLDFNPFMADFKMLINRIGADATLMGMELSIGVRL
jgi:hypothetical protein